MGPLVMLVVVIVVISAVVGVIAQFLNKLSEANAPPARRPAAPRRPVPAGEGRSADKDMDRFLAEIDRLRKKNAETADRPPDPDQPPARRKPPVTRPASPPVARPVTTRPADRPRSRPVAEVVEPPPPRRRVEPVTRAVPERIDELPVATVVAPMRATEPPPVRVTRLATRERARPKTEFARSLTALLNSGQGAAMAVVLQEVLGPPKCKKPPRTAPPPAAGPA